MRQMLGAAALVAALPLAAPIAGAQMPGPGRGPAVTFLLSHTGPLQLTDQQVVKLAAIARRAADRHKALRESFDSVRLQFRGHGDSGMRHHEGPPAQLRAAMEKERDANHADLRDALAVLTPDQQASAWELVSHSHVRMLMRNGPMMHMRTGLLPGGDGDEDMIYQAASLDDNNMLYVADDDE